MFDVIIVGAGPSGLSVGSDLSKNLKVLVLDKKPEIHTDRSWFVPSLAIADKPDISPYLYTGVRRFLTWTYATPQRAWEAQLEGGYVYVKEQEILRYWGSEIEKNGSKLLLNTLYQDHEVHDDRVTVSTDKGDFTARLLVDASGVNSLILPKYNLTDHSLYYWSIYGCIAKHPNGIGDMQVGDYMLWGTFKDTNAKLETSLSDGRPVWEYEILNENTSFPLILYLRKERIPVDVMKPEFEHILRKEKITAAFHDVEVESWKYGWYPSGGLTQQLSADRVAFIGDAGSWTTPCGWGMGFILNNYRHYAARLTEAVQKDRLSKDHLVEFVSFNSHARYEILMNQLATHFLAHASASQLDKFINFFTEVNFLICEKIFTMTLSEKELEDTLKRLLKTFTLLELMEIFPKEDFAVLLKEVESFVEVGVLDKVRSLFGHGETEEELLTQGFRFS